MSASVYKALISGALTYGGFQYLLKDDPNKMYFVASSTAGSFIGDYLISSFFPTYTSSGSLMDTAFSAVAGGGSAYAVEKLMVGNDYVMSNMSTKMGILIVSNALADYVTNMLYSSSSSSTTVTGA